MRAPIIPGEVRVTSRLAKAGARAKEGFSVAARVGAAPVKHGGRAAGKGANLAQRHIRVNGSSSDSDPNQSIQADVTSLARKTGKGVKNVPVDAVHLGGKAVRGIGGKIATARSAQLSGLDVNVSSTVSKVSAGASRASVGEGRAAMRLAGRRGRPTSSTARVLARSTRRQVKAAGSMGRETGSMVVRSASAVTRLAQAVAAHIAAAVSAVASLPVVMIAAVVAAIVAVVLSLLSWLPGFNSTQETMTPATVGDYDLVDDYPWKGHYNDGVDPLGYELGNCTSFVAWRMNRDIGVTRAPWKLKNAQLTPLGGNGGQWGATGNMPGWKIVTSPSPGDIISIPAGVELLGSSGGPYGHVGYIAQVDGNKVTIENYGHGKYFLTKPTVTQLSSYIARGEAVIKHNPKGRVTAGGSSAAKAYARKTLHDDQQYQCLVTLWNHESGWRVKADNPTSDAYGIPQALPGSKMASEGSDWKTNGVTQVKWGLKYIAGRPDYGTPCKAWELWQSRSPHWY